MKKSLKEYFLKVLKLNKILLLVILMIFISACDDSVSNDLFKKNNEVMDKASELKSYDTYDFFKEDYTTRINKVVSSISKLEGEEKDVLKKLDDYLVELTKIESEINEKVKELDTGKYLSLADKLNKDHDFSKVKISNLSTEKKKELEDLISFMNKYKEDITAKNKCTMLNNDKKGTCATLKDSITLYNQLISYESKYNAIIKESKEKKDTDKKKSSQPPAYSPGSSSNGSNYKAPSKPKNTKPKSNNPSTPKKPVVKPKPKPKPSPSQPEKPGTACWVGVNC